MLQYESELEISRILVEWYETYKRELPWRETRDPYIIWISEIYCNKPGLYRDWSIFCVSPNVSRMWHL